MFNIYMIIESARHAYLAVRMAVHHLTNKLRKKGGIMSIIKRTDCNCQKTTSHKVCVQFIHDGNSHHIRGRIAQTLHALLKASTKGITAAEMSNWALRLSAYIHILRQDYGLSIETVREPHKGGSHGRYILHSNVTLVHVSE